jgi:hypothetical protein
MWHAQPLFINFSTSSVTNFVLSRADLLLSSAMLSGMCKKGILYPFSMTSCPVTEKPYVVNPLTVAHNKGSKLRLVLDTLIRTCTNLNISMKTQSQQDNYSIKVIGQILYCLVPICYYLVLCCLVCVKKVSYIHFL